MQEMCVIGCQGAVLVYCAELCSPERVCSLYEYYFLISQSFWARLF